MDDGLRLSLLSTLLDKVHTLQKLLSFLPLTNLELKIFLEDGSEKSRLGAALSARPALEAAVDLGVDTSGNALMGASRAQLC